MQRAIHCALLRGGTSKGLYFNAVDLPKDEQQLKRVLLAVMGSPDERQIDGVGGAHPLTSKVAICSPSQRDDADIDYLFVQVVVDKAEISTGQNCGNILAGVAPFALETGMFAAAGDYTDVRIHMVNTGAIAIARVETPNGQVNYDGTARIDGVPGTSAPIPTAFLDIAGSSCGALLPTGNSVDVIQGTPVTCIDNGMPVVILDAADFGLVGTESPAELEDNAELKSRIEAIRLKVGPLMQLGDVKEKTVPKMCLVSKAVNGGLINTRTFIPHRVHEAIGVLGSVSVATACAIKGSVAQQVIGDALDEGVHCLEVEHPTGFFSVELEFSGSTEEGGLDIKRAALLRTARLLMRGDVYVSSQVWPL